jgi:hypothetical protein
VAVLTIQSRTKYCDAASLGVCTLTHRMRARWTSITCAVVVGALLFAGCGGGDDSGLSSDEKLTVIQARADVVDFCSLYQSEPSDLFDRSFEVMLKAVRDLSRVYRENPDAKIEIPVEKKSLSLKQLVQEQTAALRKCGRDGRQQAGVLAAALEQQS